MWRSRTKRKKKKHEYWIHTTKRARASTRWKTSTNSRVDYIIIVYRDEFQCQCVFVYACLAKTRKANWYRRLAHSGSLPSNFRPTRSAFRLEQPCTVCHRVNSYFLSLALFKWIEPTILNSHWIVADNWVPSTRNQTKNLFCLSSDFKWVFVLRRPNELFGIWESDIVLLPQ